MLVNSQQDLRLVYENGVNSLISANFMDNGAGAVVPRTNQKGGHLTMKQIQEVKSSGMINEREITPGYMETETTLSAGTSKYVWPIVTTDIASGGNSPLTPTMRIIVQQDSFLVNAMAYSLMSYTFTGGNQANIDFTQPNDWSPITYVDQYHGNSATVVLDEGCAMFWIGAYINITVNKHELIPYWDCKKHYTVGLAQTSTSQAPPFTLTKNSFDASASNFYPMQPNIVFGGMRNSVVSLFLPANIPANIAPFNLAAGLSPWTYGTNFVLKAVLDFQGLLMQNSTSAR